MTVGEQSGEENTEDQQHMALDDRVVLVSLPACVLSVVSWACNEIVEYF